MRTISPSRQTTAAFSQQPAITPWWLMSAAEQSADASAGESWAVLDHGRGRWPYRMTWNWGAASGVVDGRTIGLQIGGTWTDGTGSTENAVVVDGRLAKVSEESARDALRAFIAERDWAQFHSPENLAKSVAIEAGELLECFQWSTHYDLERVKGELADVLTYCYQLADQLGLDPERIILDKLEVTRQKYPADRARGRSTKYDEL